MALSLVQDCQWMLYREQEILTPRQGFLLIVKGSAQVSVEQEVLEVIEKGELIGFSAFATFPNDLKEQSVEVRTIEETTALFIPYPVLEKIPDIHDYLLQQATLRLKNVYASLAEQVKLASGFGETETFVTRVQEVMTENPIYVSPQTTIQEVAEKMSVCRTSSVLVLNENKLVGIITERDLVERVIAKGKSYQSLAQEVMSANPLTVPRFAYYYEAISEMILTGIKHMPVVDALGQLVGIVTLSDLIRKKSAGVMKTIKRIEESEEEELPKIKEATYQITDTLIREQVPSFKLLEVVTSLYDRLAVRIVELAVTNLATISGRFAFFQMGSSGRGEQFMLTDQDHFLVYSGEASEYALLGQEITRLFEKAGYARCKGLMMASEEQWRGSVQQWQERVRQWTLQATNEHLLLAHNFFSYRFVAGDAELAREFEEKISELLQRSKIFLFRLTQAEREQRTIPVIDQPIRSIFKMERKTIDLKKEVLFPYHHCLQILCLMNGILGGTSAEKIETLEQKRVFTSHFANDLKAACDQVLSLYIRLRRQKAVTVLPFSSLSTREKEELTLSLRTLRELQSIVFTRFPAS